MALALLWLLVFSRRELLIQCGAADSDQADEVRKAIRTTLSLNPALEPYIDVQNWRVICRQTGSTIQIEAADAPSAHGSRPSVVALDELVHVENREFAETLFDNLTKMANGLGIIATNAGHTRSWQADWRELARTSDNWDFRQHTQPASWLNPADIEEARRRNSPTRFNRLFRGIWSPGGGDAIEQADILACIKRTEATYAPEEGIEYTIGLDLSTKRDRSAMTLLGSDPRTNRIHVALCQSWSPIARGMVDLISVRETVETTARGFSADVVYDPHQAGLLVQELTAAGVRCIEMTFVASNLSLMATSLMQIFRQKQIELYPDPQLIADLQRLSIEERGFNHCKLVAPSDRESGHADLAISLAIAAPRAIEAASRDVQGGNIMGPLLCGQSNRSGVPFGYRLSSRNSLWG
ncbi:MAG TPA: terminase large subunit [Pirellulales bacterium]|nr:terminase large subunit [Pirellulales bacterium]